MRTSALFALLLTTTASAAQEAAPPAEPRAPLTKPHLRTSSSPDYSACSPLPEHPAKVLVGFTVDIAGHPTNVTVQLSSGSRCLDEVATQSIASYNYDPAIQDGVAVTADVAFEFTFATKDDRPYVLAAPVQKIGGDIAPPVVLTSAPPNFPHSFFHPHYPGEKAVVLVALTIDTDGLPQNIHVAKTANGRWNKSALEAVSHYRFKPATKAGNPVPVDMQVEVNFEVK